MATSNNSNTKVLRDCNNPSFGEIIGGAFIIAAFVSVWIGSLASPIVLIVAVRWEFYTLASTILFISIVSYLPWERGYISRSLTAIVDYYHPRYYTSCKTIFPADSVPTPKKSKMFYAVHPHGAFCLGWSTLFHSPIFSSQVRFCFSPALFASPLFRLWCRITGRPGKADKASMITYMKVNKESVALPPGGFEEATLSCLTQDRAYIRKRAGFVKLCLQYGYQIVPVYCFGEKSTYWNIQGAWKLRLALNGWGVPAVLVWGLPLLPLSPKRTNLLVAAGPPIQCPQIDSPTRDDVKLWHDKYMAALLAVFEEHKAEAYGEEAAKTMKLELW